MHFFLGPQAVDEKIYPDMEQYFTGPRGHLSQSEIAELARLGCTYLQLDDTALPCNCDPQVRASVSARGEEPDRLTERYIRLLNDALAGRSAPMTVALHMCRGNLKGAWMAQGGYEPIAERLFNQAQVNAFFLELDTPRAGDFAPLRHVPKDKRVVLGLISSKTPVLEPRTTSSAGSRRLRAMSISTGCASVRNAASPAAPGAARKSRRTIPGASSSW